MKLYHTNLCTSDVAELSNVFTRHFVFEVVQAGQVSPAATGSPVAAGGDYAMLCNEDGFSPVITGIGPYSPQLYPTNFHVGFIVATAEEVRVKHEELSEANRSPGPVKVFEAFGVTWTAFYCPVGDGDGIGIEVNAHT